MLQRPTLEFDYGLHIRHIHLVPGGGVWSLLGAPQSSRAKPLTDHRRVRLLLMVGLSVLLVDGHFHAGGLLLR